MELNRGVLFGRALCLGAAVVFSAKTNAVASSVEWCEPPSKPIGVGLILLSTGDGGSWEPELTKLGFQCIRFDDSDSLPAGQRAVRLVRSQAKAHGVDPEKIGVVGRAAGGRLAVRLATCALAGSPDGTSCHVNWAIADAPVFTPEEAAGKFGADFAFDAKTCPVCFLHAGGGDDSSFGSARCYRELRKRNIPAEVHFYSRERDKSRGLGRAVEFMRQLGFMGELKEEKQQHRFHPDGTARTEKQDLWPDRPSKPYLVWYYPEKQTTKAVQVVFAGGGYGFCNYVGEAEPVAYFLNQKGMTVVCVKYRCSWRPEGTPKHAFAWADAQRAIRLVRAGALAHGLDPDRIGALGFSAGGHLTLLTALSSGMPAYEPKDEIDRFSCAVQWACPIYPAYALTDGAEKPNAHGGNLDEDVPVPEFAFDSATPPMCFVHGDDDCWASMNSVKCWERLQTMGRASDLHTLATRGHCFQMSAAPGTGSYTWMDRVWEFLDANGFNR